MMIFVCSEITLDSYEPSLKNKYITPDSIVSLVTNGAVYQIPNAICSLRVIYDSQ